MDKTPDTPLHQAFIRVIHAAGVQHNLSAHQIDQITASAWDRLTQTMGCRTAYIPAPSQHKRDEAIADAWHAGQPFAAIARDFPLSESRIRQIINHRRHRHQP
ncbi:MAG: hypothetical protein K9L32_11440 [Chromatiaceae bacterium]|nr:hypothetical protein [Chromatiaceae bacterium]